jgi:hypothetical protein
MRMEKYINIEPFKAKNKSYDTEPLNVLLNAFDPVLEVNSGISWP